MTLRRPLQCRFITCDDGIMKENVFRIAASRRRLEVDNTWSVLRLGPLAVAFRCRKLPALGEDYGAHPTRVVIRSRDGRN